ncbi:hpcH/HpaI aldolase/citrate lyase family protein [Paraburkholderia fungorum]|uniref:HpcH/HpaI aldolase/citrate lyase family protein n=1 Tax=Paraburkholderia fungorum TaxID=134537 RepID=A0AAU8T689_9BURK|nr:CoA ester lyase [Paraburkholderia fungorum]AJZ57068.1 hpcH/HpaI aldolase/citrate lyase family protein [Paraburkholderia fungorum]
MTLPPPRSYLFVPGNRPERFEKACRSGADAVIIDLEDAVPPADKVAARAHVQDWLARGGAAYVRVNAPDTEWFIDDVREIALIATVRGIVLPKAERREQIDHVCQLAHRSAECLPILESAQGFANIRSLCEAPRMSRLLFGSLDLQADLRIGADDEALHYFRSMIVLHSRAARLVPPVDGVTTSFEDVSQIRHDTEQAKRFGFRAKLCIHPKQIALVHDVFAPSAAELEWARRVIAGIDASAGGAVAIDGKMVDAPVILKAREILASAHAHARHE